MSRNARVSLSDPAGDRPRPLGATVIALFALCAGVASAYGVRGMFSSAPEARPEDAIASRARSPAQPERATPAASTRSAGPPRPHSAPLEPAVTAQQPPAASAPIAPDADLTQPTLANAPATAPTNALAPAPTNALAPAPTNALAPALAPAPAPANALAPAPANALAPALANTPALASALAPAPAPASATPDAAQPQLTFKHGHVAYLRCDGLPPSRGPFPCPRDRDMEKQVWSALLGLERCAPLELRGRRGDVRIEFTSDATTWTTIAEVDRSAVVRCAGAALARVETSLRPTRMIVSFRFALQ